MRAVQDAMNAAGFMAAAPFGRAAAPRVQWMQATPSTQCVSLMQHALAESLG